MSIAVKEIPAHDINDMTIELMVKQIKNCKKKHAAIKFIDNGNNKLIVEEGESEEESEEEDETSNETFSSIEKEENELHQEVEALQKQNAMLKEMI